MSGSKRVRITRAQFSCMVVNSMRTVSGERPSDDQVHRALRLYSTDMTVADAKLMVSVAVQEFCPVECAVTGAFEPLWTTAERQAKVEQLVAQKSRKRGG